MKRRFLIKTIALFITAIMLFGAKKIQAADNNQDQREQLPQVVESTEDVVTYSINAFSYKKKSPSEMLAVSAELENRIKEALLNGTTILNISDLEINDDENPMHYYYAYSPYFEEGITLTFFVEKSTRNYIELMIDNPYSAAEIASYFSQVDAKLDFYRSLVTDSMSDEEKALIIHDYLVSHTEYDWLYTEYSCSGVFLRESGVCQSYAMAYAYIMNHLGIECYFRHPSGTDHVWNVILLNGDFYNVDCGFDDYFAFHEIQKLQIGLVSHEYFLQSDPTLRNKGYGNLGTDEFTCEKENYRNSYWVNATSPVVLLDHNAYYIQNNTLVKRSNETGAVQNIVSLGATNVDIHSGLALLNKELYFNTDLILYKYSLQTQQSTPIYRVESDTKVLNGCFENDGDIRFAVANSSKNEIGSTALLSQSIKDGWHYTEQGRWIYYQDRHFVSGWQSIKNIWYYFSSDGIMQVNQWIGSYYVKSDGSMARSEWVDGNRYYVDANGVWDQSKKDTWVKEGSKWWYRHANGSYTKNGWEQIQGKQYYFDANGWMVANQWIGHYYLKSDGSMARSEWVENSRYYVDANGLWDQGKTGRWFQSGSRWWYRHCKDGSYTKNGWEPIDGTWYHFDSAGWMDTNKWIGNYYVKSSGAMAKSEWVDGGRYYVDSKGVWDTTKKNQWIQEKNGKWWYRHANGSYTKNAWEQIGGKWYHFDASGWMDSNKWIGDYYVRSDGSMAVSQWIGGDRYYVNAQGVWDKHKSGQWLWSSGKWWYQHDDKSYTRSGWEAIGSKWYHFDSAGWMDTDKWIGDYYALSDGSMATNQWIGSYYVGSDGRWVRNK